MANLPLLRAEAAYAPPVVGRSLFTGAVEAVPDGGLPALLPVAVLVPGGSSAMRLHARKGVIVPVLVPAAPAPAVPGNCTPGSA